MTVILPESHNHSIQGVVLAVGEYENGGLLRWRVNKTADDVREINDWRRNVDAKQVTQDVTILNIHEDMEELKTLVNRLILSVVGLCLTIAGSSVGIVIGLG
jgi:hypothetical protein